MQRTRWVAPKLVRKPVSDTFAGAGISVDGIGGEFVVDS